MAADDYNPVSLRHKSKKKSREGNGMMSRRRISVKELGQPDHQGWLYRKKESKGFLGIKWKKYWFVLKKTSLYWYTTPQAEKAEGYINLADFMIDRAIECKKKHAFKACHLQVMMFYFAAESFEDMNLWLNKLGLASIQYEPADRNHAVECYSEASDHEEAESTDLPPPPYSEQTLRDSMGASGPPGSTHQGTLPPPYSSSAAPGPANGSLSSPVSTMTSQSSASSSSLAKQRQSWLDLVSQAAPPPPACAEAAVVCAEAAVVCSAQVHSRQRPVDEVDAHPVPQGPSRRPAREAESNEGDSSSEEDEVQTADCDAEEDEEAGTNSDEMEKLYIHLKEASLSPTGQRKPSTKREFRASFIKRCKNQTLNDRLHQIRTLNSTLKSKEADLQAIEQVLSDPQLTAGKFREWKEANVPLVQEIYTQRKRQVAAESMKEGAVTLAGASVVESSL